jgi:hypothetical protein
VIRLALVGALVVLAACAPSPDCLEAQRIYDAAPSVWAGTLTATVCAR